MKKLTIIFALLLTTFSIVSCDKSPDNKIHSTKTEDAGWVVQEAGKNPVMGVDTFYQISPTWSQSINYSNKREDRPLTLILGSICLLGFLILFIGKVMNASWFPEKLDTNIMLFNALLFVLLTAAVYFYFGDASDVKWNNDKWVKKELYDNTMKSGSTQAIWDSLENNCLIIDGPYNCYK